jgi:hypothetical protein
VWTDRGRSGRINPLWIAEALLPHGPIPRHIGGYFACVIRTGHRGNWRSAKAVGERVPERDVLRRRAGIEELGNRLF